MNRIGQLLGLAVLLCSSMLYAELDDVRTQNDSPFLLQTWTVGDGLPLNHVRDIIQRSNGFIWVATRNGAARFDGVRFQPFNMSNTPELPNNLIGVLYEDDVDVLWLGHDTGAVSCRKGNGFFSIETPDDWPDLPVVGFVNRDNGFYAVNESGGMLQIFQDAPAKVLGQLFDVRLFQDAASSEGGKWVVQSKTLCREKDGQVIEERASAPWQHVQMLRIAELSDGRVAVGTTFGGLFVFNRDGSYDQVQYRTGLAANQVSALFEDREGTLWVGTTAGLNTVRRRRFSSLTAPDNWRFQALRSIAPCRDGGVWVGTRAGEVYCVERNRIRYLRKVPNVGNVRALLEDSSGNLWMNDDGGGFLARYDDDSRVSRILPQDGAQDMVWVLYEDAAGRLWAGGEKGLWTREDSDWTLVFGREDHVFDVRCIASGFDGDLWFGMKSGGLGLVRDGQLKLFGRDDGLAGDRIISLYADPDRRGLWIGTSGHGLVLRDNDRFFDVSTPWNIVADIGKDTEGRFWVVGERGVIALESEALYERAVRGNEAGTPILLDANDGLNPAVYVETGLSTSCMADANEFWILGQRSVAVLHPAEIVRNQTPVPVLIKNVLVNDTLIPLNVATNLLLEPGVHRMNINYSALSYSAPRRIHFKYRMVGARDKWTYMGTKRIVSYQHLPPGNYRFEVLAANSDGVWNRNPSVLKFTVKPFFWETWWFHALFIIGGFVLVALITAGVAERINRKKVIRAESLHAVERERTRIAMDIHDEIGSELTRVTLLCNRVLNAIRRNDYSSAPRIVSELDIVTKKLVRSLDEIVWVVRPINDTLDSLVAYLSKYASDYLHDAGVDCELDIPVELPALALSGPMRHNLFLAVKEALNNIVKHSGSETVKFSVSAGPEEINFLLADNGRGLGNMEDERFHRGLKSMKRRMDLVNGTFSIKSGTNGGTQVEFLIPCREAGV